MLSLKLTAKQFWILLSLVLVGAAAYFLLVQPMRQQNYIFESKLKTIREEISGMSRNRPNLTRLEREFQKSQKEHEELKNRIQIQSNRVLGREELETLLNAKTIFSLNHGAPHVRVKRRESVPMGGYFKELYWVKINGGYNDILRYAQAIERSSPYIQIEKLQIIKLAKRVGASLDGELEIRAVTQEKNGFYGPREAMNPKASLFGERNPFIYTKRSLDRSAVEGFELGAILFDLTERYAVINGNTYRENDTIATDVILKEITQNGVIVQNKGQDLALRL